MTLKLLTDYFPKVARDFVDNVWQAHHSVNAEEIIEYQAGKKTLTQLSYTPALYAENLILAALRTALAAGAIFAAYSYGWQLDMTAVACLSLSAPAAFIGIGAHLTYIGVVKMIQAIAIDSFTKAVSGFGIALLGWAVLDNYEKYQKVGFLELSGSLIPKFADFSRGPVGKAIVWLKINIC